MTKRKLIRGYLESVLLAVVLALILRSFVFSAYRIPTASMFPTLQPGDFVFIYKLPYGFALPFADKKVFVSRMPQRGDVVVFRYPNDDKSYYIKRVVAVAGDRVEIKNHQLVVNEKRAKYVPREFEGDGFEAASYYELREETVLDSTRVIMTKKEGGQGDFGPAVIPPDQFFVLGDNRDSSDDSRYWGVIPNEKIEGRVAVIWLSLDWSRRNMGGKLPSVRWNRVFQTVQ